MNVIGLVTAASTFFSIWFGHVAVRKIEFRSPTIWVPAVIFASVGLGLEYWSLHVSSPLSSAALGILGMTLLWDALELTRQQNRIKKGHAPANLKNPRHARLMHDYPSITSVDLLKRNPVGRTVSYAEAINLLAEHEFPMTNYE